MKASKKLLSLLLVLTMVFSFAAISASAEGFVIQGRTEPEQQSSQNDDNSNQQDATIVGENDNAADGEKNETSAETSTEDDKADDADKQDEPEVADPVAIIVVSKKTYKYATLQEAIAAAAEGATVQLVKDITLSAPLTISKNLTLELAEATITFKSSSNLYDAALIVDDGASVTLRNGEVVFVAVPDEDNDEVFYGFKSGLDAANGILNLRGMNVNGTVVGGSKLTNADNGSINVKDGEFDFDPSAYVDESYAANEIDGIFTVAEKPAETQRPSNGPMKVVRPTQEGDKLTESKTENLEVKENMTLDLAGFVLTGKITVADGAVLKLVNSNATTAGKIDGSIELTGGLIIENNVVVTGDIVMKDNSQLHVASSDVKVEGKVKLADGAKADTIEGRVTAGTFGELPPAFIPSTHVINAGVVTEKAPQVTPNHTVKDASGNSYNDSTNYLQYFKGETELAPEQPIVYIDKAVFVIDTKPTSVEVGGNALTENTHYTWDGTNTLRFKFEEANVGTDKVKITAPAFENLDAGKYNIVFKFDSDSTHDVTVPLYVWASIVTTDVKHVVGNTTDKTIEMSDKPVSVLIGDTAVEENGGKNWSYDAGKLTLKASYLDTVAAGDHDLCFKFKDSDSKFVSNLAIINVTPVEANKDNKWLNSNTALSYNASHAVTAVSVKPSKGDVKTLTKDTDYSVSDKNVLSLKAAFLKQLPYGEHTMTVSLNGETVTVKFTTAPSLVPKDATNHTKGGQKDLVFIASDKMDAVWVGQTRLKTDYYTISSDGKTITLKAAFLNTLKADTTYTITTALMNADGKTAQYSAATSFKIISAATAGATPGTGDSANFGLWIALLVISGAAIAVILPKKHKEN